MGLWVCPPEPPTTKTTMVMAEPTTVAIEANSAQNARWRGLRRRPVKVVSDVSDRSVVTSEPFED